MNKQVQKLQKNSGIKMGQYDNKKNQLYHQGQLLIQVISSYIKAIEEANMTNEQFFINFEDTINELSIKNHNASLE